MCEGLEVKDGQYDYVCECVNMYVFSNYFLRVCCVGGPELLKCWKPHTQGNPNPEGE